MDKNSIDFQLQTCAHSIVPTAPEHIWKLLATLHFTDGRVESIYQCTGCPCEKRSMK